MLRLYLSFYLRFVGMLAKEFFSIDKCHYFIYLYINLPHPSSLAN